MREYLLRSNLKVIPDALAFFKCHGVSLKWELCSKTLLNILCEAENNDAFFHALISDFVDSDAPNLRYLLSIGEHCYKKIVPNVEFIDGYAQLDFYAVIRDEYIENIIHELMHAIFNADDCYDEDFLPLDTCDDERCVMRASNKKGLYICSNQIENAKIELSI